MRKLFSTIITVLLLVSILAGAVASASPESAVPCESGYLLAYSATAATGSERGAIKVTFIVKGMQENTTQIGVSKISVCRYDGTPMKTIYGSTANGLLAAGVLNYSGSYEITGLEPGTSYYALVTIIAADASGSDTRVVTTNTVKAAS